MPGHGTARPKLSLPAVLREGVAAYRAHWRVLLVTAVALFVPLGLLEVLTENLHEIETESALVAAELVAIVLGISLTATLGDVFYTGVVAAAVSSRRAGVRRELTEIIRELPFLRLLAVDVLFAVVVGLGLLLLVVPGVIAFGWFALAPAAVEIEGRGVRDAFRRSRQLVRGNFCRVLALLAPVTIAGDALSELLGDTGPRWLGDTFVADWLGVALADIVTAPLFALAAVTAAHHLIAGLPEEAPEPVG